MRRVWLPVLVKGVLAKGIWRRVGIYFPEEGGRGFVIFKCVKFLGVGLSGWGGLCTFFFTPLDLRRDNS